jgi:hypothetical protein
VRLNKFLYLELAHQKEILLALFEWIVRHANLGVSPVQVVPFPVVAAMTRAWLSGLFNCREAAAIVVGVVEIEVKANSSPGSRYTIDVVFEWECTIRLTGSGPLHQEVVYS